MGSLTPHISVAGAAAAIDFYRRAFGTVEAMRHAMPDGSKIMHARLTFPDGGELFLADDFPEFNNGKSSAPPAFGGSPVTLHLSVDDVDALWAQAVAAGATITMPLADQFWGDRYGRLRDPFGHEWSLSSPQRNPSVAELDAGARKFVEGQK
jgi:PhnB protein